MAKERGRPCRIDASMPIVSGEDSIAQIAKVIEDRGLTPRSGGATDNRTLTWAWGRCWLTW
jgi:hypothetical protein